MQELDQQTSQEQTEEQNLRGGRVDQPLKHCED